ncbi:MAG TPA: ATP phosphoribosyltransferase regulatory subunit [Thermoanaerobaculia bacterium]|jgi:ATP phosphoribosyltransferase regulatory subunit
MASTPRYPIGVRALLVEEAARRRRIETRFIDALERAGFAEVVLPIIDYVEPYAEIVDRDSTRKSYRFIDREGELVAVRSDFTPMLARALAPAMRDDELPLRLFYRGDVIRCEASRLGVNRELFQIGAEVVGDGSVDADVATLRLASTLVHEFNGRATIVYNDVSIAAALIERSPAVATALANKRANGELPDDLRPVVKKLIGGEATIDDVEPFAPEAAARLRAIGGALDPEEFALHLDDFDEAIGYYTGIRFRVYGKGLLARGGRYDNLYSTFGQPAAAIGFTFTIDDLLE